IQDAELYPKATDHIPEMIAIVKRLLDRQLAYKAEDGSVYFAIDKFKDYGKLSRLDTREVKAGARVIQDDYSKENAQDCARGTAARWRSDSATSRRCRIFVIRAFRRRRFGTSSFRRTIESSSTCPVKRLRRRWKECDGSVISRSG